MCGFARDVPVLRLQRFPEGALHVGQGTECTCLGVNSEVLIELDSFSVTF